VSVHDAGSSVTDDLPGSRDFGADV